MDQEAVQRVGKRGKDTKDLDFTNKVFSTINRNTYRPFMKSLCQNICFKNLLLNFPS